MEKVMLIILSIILFILMSLVGGDRGAKSFFALCINAFIIIVNIYLIYIGLNAIIIMLLSSILFSAVTLVFQNDYNMKTLASITSVGIVVLILCILVTFICYKAHMIGYNEIEILEENSMYLSSDIHINMYHILICGIVWGLLGAIIDTSISISTAINEIHNNNRKLSSRELMRSGMTVGKDILGTTVNTLFFVCTGETIMLSLVYLKYSYSFEEILNSKSFIQEVSTLLISCIGCLLIIPITAAIFSRMVKEERLVQYFRKHEEVNE
jgi:uncharacterized membrane protein